MDFDLATETQKRLIFPEASAMGHSTLAHVFEGRPLADVQRDGRRLVALLSHVATHGGFGDLNADGVTSVADLIVLTNYINGTGDLSTKQHALADVNGDGRADRLDRDLLSRMIAGSPVTIGEGKRLDDTAYGANGNGYFMIGKQIAGAPPAGDCAAISVGAVALDTSNFRMYVCFSTGWRVTQL